MTTIFRDFKKFNIVYKLCFYISIYLFSCNSFYIYFLDNKTIYNMVWIIFQNSVVLKLIYEDILNLNLNILLFYTCYLYIQYNIPF